MGMIKLESVKTWITNHSMSSECMGECMIVSLSGLECKWVSVWVSDWVWVSEWVWMTACATYLREHLVLKGHLSVVTDLPQGGPEAPLISRHAQVVHCFDALWCYPRDAAHTLWKSVWRRKRERKSIRRKRERRRRRRRENRRRREKKRGCGEEEKKHRASKIIP